MSRCRSTMAVIFAASLAASYAHAADAALIEAAKKEGEVVWYSTQIISQLVRPVTAAFEKKYPGIKVRSTRANASRGRGQDPQRDARPARVQSDVFDGTTTVVPLKKEGYVLNGCRTRPRTIPATLKDPEGYWIANNLFIITPGFNTSLVPRGHRAEDLSGPARSEMARQDGLERLPDQLRHGRASSAPC